MPRAKVIPKKKSPEEYVARIKEMRSKLNNPDRKDYQRTIAGRGDTHALDGGKIHYSKTAKGKAFQEKLQSWNDRNTNNADTKLSKEKPLAPRKPLPRTVLSPDDKRYKGNR